MEKKILIFTATYNESENIEVLIKDINNLSLNLDLLIVDDNSPDKTWEIIEKSDYKKNINLIKREKKLGLDTAHKTAYNYSIKKKYDYLITMDADLSHDPKVIPSFLKELEKNPFVIGSRYMEGGSCEMKGFRKLISFLGNKFIKIVFNFKCDEFTTSFRGFNLKKLSKFDMNKISSKGYSFFMETVYEIHKSNYKIKQIPIHFANRERGKSKIPKVEIFRTLLNLIKLKLFKK